MKLRLEEVKEIALRLRDEYGLELTEQECIRARDEDLAPWELETWDIIENRLIELEAKKGE